jgi:DNA primase
MSEFEKLINICHANLHNSEQCMSYLKEKRGLNDSSIEKFKIGYFPQNIDKLTKYVSRNILEKANIVNYNGSSKFSDFFYLIFPMYNEYGDAVGINGRALVSDVQRDALNIPKYENSSYKKANILFGLNHARGNILSKNNVFICEGNFDVIQMHKNGINNSVAICGTAFSKNHFIKLSRYANTFTFILDSDSGGEAAISHINKKFINKGINLKFMSLPDGFKDVDEFFKSGKSKRDFFNSLIERDLEIEGMEWK